MKAITKRLNASTLAFVALVCLCRFSADAQPGGEVYIKAIIQAQVVGTIKGEPVEMRVHANAQVFDDGTATGTLQVRVDGGENFLYRVVQGEAIIEEGTVVQLILTLERVGEDGEPTGESDLAIVRPSSSIQDCLIYDIVGPIVHVEAQGVMGLRHEHVRPELF